MSQFEFGFNVACILMFFIYAIHTSLKDQARQKKEAPLYKSFLDGKCSYVEYLEKKRDLNHPLGE